MRLFAAFLFAALLACASFVSAQTVIAGCEFGGVDYSSLNGATDLTTNDPTYTYYVSICGTVHNSQCAAQGPLTSVCQSPTAGGGCYDLGDFASNTVQWSWADAAKTQPKMSLTGANKCWTASGVEAYTSTITLTCPSNGVAGPLNVTQTGSCSFAFTYPTPLACPSSGGGGGGGGSSKLSGGWVFIIILSVTIPLYVIIGCVFKAKQRGAEGMERCPNVEFWRELPGLVKDGFSFTFRKIAGLCGGGGGAAAGGKSSYESM